MPEPITRRGKVTKARIVELAAALMYERGVSATSIEDILTASGTGKSQLYHYFSSKEELVAEVLRHQLQASSAAAEPVPPRHLGGHLRLVPGNGRHAAGPAELPRLPARVDRQ